MNDLTCIHCEAGLCEACRAEYDTDAEAWLEYGDHPAGLARWRELEDELAEEAARERAALDALAREPFPVARDDEIPF